MIRSICSSSAVLGLVEVANPTTVGIVLRYSFSGGRLRYPPANRVNPAAAGSIIPQVRELEQLRHWAIALEVYSIQLSQSRLPVVENTCSALFTTGCKALSWRSCTKASLSNNSDGVSLVP